MGGLPDMPLTNVRLASVIVYGPLTARAANVKIDAVNIATIVAISKRFK